MTGGSTAAFFRALGLTYPAAPLTLETVQVGKAATTLRQVFGLRARDKVFVKLFSSPIRGDTPAACLADVGRDEQAPMTDRSATPVLSRPPDDEAALDAWANAFVNAVLGVEEQIIGEGTPPEV